MPPVAHPLLQPRRPAVWAALRQQQAPVAPWRQQQQCGGTDYQPPRQHEVPPVGPDIARDSGQAPPPVAPADPAPAAQHGPGAAHDYASDADMQIDARGATGQRQ